MLKVINEKFDHELKNSSVDRNKFLLESLEEIDQEEIVDDVDDSIKSRRSIRIKEDIENTYEVTIYDNQNNIVDWFEDIKASTVDEAKKKAFDLSWEDSDDAWEVNHMSKEEYREVFGDKTIEEIKSDWISDKYVDIK